jgi:F0F1-type ATP synthase assembly protein I
MKKNEEKKTFSASSLAFELGYLIAIPIVLLAFTGRWLDKHFNTSPWLLLIGVLLSIIISSFAIYKKTINIIKDVKAKDKQ